MNGNLKFVMGKTDKTLLVRILIVGSNQSFINRLKKIVNHPQVIVNDDIEVNEALYDFYVLEESKNFTDSVDKIRRINEGSPIYLFGSVCETSVPVRKIIKCNIVNCLDNDEDMYEFAKTVKSFRKQKDKMYKGSAKLDCLRAGDFKSLTRQLQKTESDKFMDYIQNHPLPMVLVNQEGDVLHANEAMEDMVGIKLSGAPASVYWDDAEEFNKTLFDLKEKGQLLNREVTLKTIDEKRMLLKLYTSIHYDDEGNWLNTRCLFVPMDLYD